jgi:hypothetical protein
LFQKSSWGICLRTEIRSNSPCLKGSHPNSQVLDRVEQQWASKSASVFQQNVCAGQETCRVLWSSVVMGVCFTGTSAASTKTDKYKIGVSFPTTVGQIPGTNLPLRSNSNKLQITPRKGSPLRAEDQLFSRDRSGPRILGCE